MATESLKAILEKVDAGRIVLPEFQRDFVWSQSAVMKLMASIMNGYPIGSLLLMENNDAYSYRSIDGAHQPGEVDHKDQDLILDGQQRVTSCYRAFYGTTDTEAKNPGRYYFNYGRYVESAKLGEFPTGSSVEELFEFYRPLKIKKSLKTMSEEVTAGLLPLDIILESPRGYNYAKWLGTYNFNNSQGNMDLHADLTDISSRLQSELIENITGYQVNFEKITRETNPDVICTIFETINTTGVKLTVFDLLVAKCFKRKVMLREMLEAAVESKKWIKLFDPEGKDIASVQLPRILGLLIKKECLKASILALDPDDIRDRWDQAVKGLDEALEAIHQRYGSVTSDWIPSSDIIAPLAYIITDSRFAKPLWQKVDQWYWRTVFGSYLRGAPETKIGKTIRDICHIDGNWMDGGDTQPESVSSFQFRTNAIEEATKVTTVYKGLMSLMISKGPYDIGLERKYFGSLKPNEIHDHHIFPQKFLRDSGIKGTKANQITNRMPIWRSTNEAIGSYAPNVYVKDSILVSSKALDDLVEYYHVDISKFNAFFSVPLYEEFLEARKESFIRAIAKAVEAEPKGDMFVSDE